MFIPTDDDFRYFPKSRAFCLLEIVSNVFAARGESNALDT